MTNFIKGQAYYKECDASYYDANALTNSGNAKYPHLSPYYALYQETIVRIQQLNAQKILEAGCGNGIFSELLKATGNFIYIGFDFSEQRLSIARSRVPEYTYLQQNIYATDIFTTAEYDVVVCHEVLEHLKNDYKVFKSIPKGKHILFSVPEFDSGAHVRYFTSELQIVKRYSKYVQLDEILKIGGVFLVNGIVK